MRYVLLFIALLFVFAWGAAADEREIEDVEWMTDLAAAGAKAREEGRPLLVVFR